MRSIRRLSYVALVIAFAQIVFGAIVRITGSGWGCGEHWPKCAGYWIPPLERPDLIIEVSHRYLALGVTLVTLALAITAWRRRDEPGVAGRGGPLRPAIAAFLVVVATALLGAITIKLRLNPIVIVLHLALAMTLLAAIIAAAIRSGGFGAPRAVTAGDDASRVAAAKTWRVARIGLVLAFIVLVLGALTANLGAAGACLGFPNCRVYSSPQRGLVHLQLTHRILAFLFALHVLGAAMMTRKRAVAPVVKRAVFIALGAVVLQILVAASLVEMHLPPVLQSLHQAVGTLVWIAVVIWALLAHRAAGSEPATLGYGSPSPVPLPVDREVDAGTVRRTEPATGASLIVAPAIDASTVSRFAELERAGRTYASAIAALVAEGEATADSFDESLVQVTGDVEPVTEREAIIAVEAVVADEVPPAPLAEVEAAPAAAEPVLETNYVQYVTNSTACGEVPLAAVMAPLPEPDPVVLPPHVVTPAQPMPAIKRAAPHSVAVIVARGADF